jgi:hypothetical protein
MSRLWTGSEADPQTPLYEFKKELLKVKLKDISCPHCDNILTHRILNGDHEPYLLCLHCSCDMNFELIVNVSRDRIWEWTNGKTSPEYTYESYLQYRKMI